jgi:hypothetical protein
MSESSQDRADDFAERLGGQVAKALGKFITSPKPTQQIEKAQAGKATRGEMERRHDEQRLADLMTGEQQPKAAGPNPDGLTSKRREETSLPTDPPQGRIRAGKNRGRM